MTCQRACDRGAKVNAQGFRNAWIGYKFHIDAIDTGMPVSCILSSASVHDGQVAIPLADMTAQRITYLYECMDSAYDAAQIHDHSQKHGRVSIIDTNPRRNKNLKESLARERKAADRAGFIHPTDQRYGERTVVERVNGLWKSMQRSPTKRANRRSSGPALICCRNSFSSCNSFSSSNDGTANRVDLRRKDRAGPAAAPPNCRSVPQWVRNER